MGVAKGMDDLRCLVFQRSVLVIVIEICLYLGSLQLQWFIFGVIPSSSILTSLMLGCCQQRGHSAMASTAKLPATIRLSSAENIQHDPTRLPSSNRVV